MDRGTDRDVAPARLGERPGFDEWAAEVTARLKARREGDPPGRRRSKPRGRVRSLLDRLVP